MEKYDSTPLFRLGHTIGGLISSINSTLTDSTWAASRLKVHLGLFVNQNKDNSQFKHSVNSARLVISCIDDFIDKEKNKDRLAGITDEIFIPKDMLMSSLDDFQTFLQGELPQLNIYFVTKHRAYDMTVLINEGENLLSPNTLTAMTGSKMEVIRDISEAARSLAFGFYTAVGFHLYRAIEAIVIKEYFVSLKVPHSEYNKSPNLGNYIKILKVTHDKIKLSSPVDIKVTSLLDHIKVHYRNPVMHPEESWDMDKANSAIGPAISLIDMMMQDIQEIKKKGTPHYL